MKKFFYFTSFVALLSASPLDAITIAGYTTDLHDRFTNSPDFIASDLDLSGVAISDNGRWVTMLTPNVFISSNHFFPGVGQNVTFYAGNDPAGGSVSRSIASNQRIASSDIRIGTINSPLPGSYAFYEFARSPITNDNTAGAGPLGSNEESFINSEYFEENAWFLGRSPSSFPTSQDMALGRNVIDRFESSRTAVDSTDIALGAVVDAPSSGNFVTHEAAWQIGDSGSPVLVSDTSGGITVVGTGWFILEDSGGSVVQNGMTYFGNYADEIDAFIAANPVPEPQAMALFLGFAAAVTAARRRRR